LISDETGEQPTEEAEAHQREYPARRMTARGKAAIRRRDSRQREHPEGAGDDEAIAAMRAPAGAAPARH